MQGPEMLSRSKSRIREFPDRAIRTLFESPASFLRLVALLAPELASGIDPRRTVRLDRSSFDSRLRLRESDLHFRANFPARRRTGLPRRGRVHFLFEHQSTLDPWMPVRLLHLMAGIWDRERRERPKPACIPGIIPIVLYTGERPWSSPIELEGLVDSDLRGGTAAFVPRFRVLWLDLARAGREILEERDPILGSVLRAFARARAGRAEFATTLERASAALATAPGPGAALKSEYVRFLCQLIIHRRARREHECLFDALASRLRAADQREVTKMKTTYADDLIREGLKEGLKEGRKEGRLAEKREVLLNLLKVRFGRVPVRIADQVRRTRDARRLDRWLERILTASSIGEMRIVAKNGSR
ncbi:MAG: Rpn family recombination-promoting nuclease/putative transposase [Planctomycetes bacterium]|nr:Rpn family recombination-promoting nuclease/putative transposase [Planctomycetota bacterium]